MPNIITATQPTPEGEMLWRVSLLGIEHEAVQVDMEFDDDMCTWVEDE